MARPSTRTPITTFVFGPDDAALTFVYFTGFICMVAYQAGLDITGRTIRPNSMFGPLIAHSNVRIVLVEHPARPLDPFVDFEEVWSHCRGYVVCCGLSRGGQVAAQLHRWLRVRLGTDEKLGLVPISMPTCVDDLKQGTAAKLIQCLRVPYALGGPIMWLAGGLAFTSRQVKHEMRRQGRADEIRTIEASARRSAWMIATIRALATTVISGEPIPAGPRVMVANVEQDKVIYVRQADDTLGVIYPDCGHRLISGTTMHGRPELDLVAYREFWEDMYVHFTQLFGLASL